MLSSRRRPNSQLLCMDVLVTHTIPGSRSLVFSKRACQPICLSLNADPYRSMFLDFCCTKPHNELGSKMKISIVHCWWEDQVARERTGYLPKSAQDEKSLRLCPYGCILQLA